jgi:hypothetical protein
MVSNKSELKNKEHLHSPIEQAANIYPKEPNSDIMKLSNIFPNTITMVLYMLNECNASNQRHAPGGQIQSPDTGRARLQVGGSLRRVVLGITSGSRYISLMVDWT